MRGEGDRLVVYANAGLLRRLLPLVAAVAPLALVLLMETLPSDSAFAGLSWPVRGLWRLWEVVFFVAVLVTLQMAVGGVWQALRHRAVLRLDPGGVTDTRDGSPIASWDRVAEVRLGTTTLDAGSVRRPRRRYGRMHNDRFPVLALRLEPPASAGADMAARASVAGDVVHLDIEDRSRPPDEIVEFARRLHARYHDRPPTMPPAPLPSRGLAKGGLLVGLSLVLALASFVAGVTIVEPELSANAPSGRGPLGAEATYDVGTFTVSRVEVVEDFAGDFGATATVTNQGAQRTGRSAVELTLLRAGQEVGRVSGRVGSLQPGASERVELWGVDDYVEGVDELVFRIG